MRPVHAARALDRLMKLFCSLEPLRNEFRELVGSWRARYRRALRLTIATVSLSFPLEWLELLSAKDQHECYKRCLEERLAREYGPPPRFIMDGCYKACVEFYDEVLEPLQESLAAITWLFEVGRRG